MSNRSLYLSESQFPPAKGRDYWNNTALQGIWVEGIWPQSIINIYLVYSATLAVAAGAGEWESRADTQSPL